MAAQKKGVVCREKPGSKMDIAKYLKHNKALVDSALKECLPPEGTRPEILHEAMHYCVLNGGKRIRPILCIAAADMTLFKFTTFRIFSFSRPFCLSCLVLVL